MRFRDQWLQNKEWLVDFHYRAESKSYIRIFQMHCHDHPMVILLSLYLLPVTSSAFKTIWTWGLATILMGLNTGLKTSVRINMQKSIH